MPWNQILCAILTCAAASATSTFDLHEAPAPTVDELLTYECARAVATMVNRGDQLGPVFTQGSLVFSSVETTDGGRTLIVNAGAGTYAVPLDHTGVNRVRFELPTSRTARPQMFFLSYLHDTAVRSRVFEYSEMRAPAGKEELDYKLVQPLRAPYLLSHLEYAIWETSQSALSAVTDGQVSRKELIPRKADCDHLSRKSPLLARGLRRNLDELELMAVVPQVKTLSSRLPASVRADRH